MAGRGSFFGKGDAMISPRNAFVFFLLVGAAQTAYYYQKLPSKMASHFGNGGNPNGWMDKPAFFVFYICFLLLLGLILFFIPNIIRRIPPSLVSMPKSEYWLAPERIDVTIEKLKQKFVWFAGVTLLFVVSCVQLTIEANLSESGYLAIDTFWLLFAIYIIFAIAWVVKFIRLFNRIPG